MKFPSPDLQRAALNAVELLPPMDSTWKLKPSQTKSSQLNQWFNGGDLIGILMVV